MQSFENLSKDYDNRIVSHLYSETNQTSQVYSCTLCDLSDVSCVKMHALACQSVLASLMTCSMSFDE